jgi:hypothetical protein
MEELKMILDFRKNNRGKKANMNLSKLAQTINI